MLSNVVIKGHEYSEDEILSLPDRALSMGGTNQTHAKIDADRGVAFLTDVSGRPIVDRNNQPEYVLIRKKGQKHEHHTAASQDMLMTISATRRKMNEAPKKKRGAYAGVFNPTIFLCSMAVVVVVFSVLVFFFMF